MGSAKLRPVLTLFRSWLTRFWPIIVIVTIGSLSLTWFKGEILAGGDVGTPPPANILWTSLYLWDSTNPWLGSLNTAYGASIVPYAVFWSTLREAGLSLALVDRAWDYLLFTLPGLGAYYLVSSVGINSRLVRSVCSILYMVNPYVVYTLTISGPLNTSIQFAYIAAPLFLALAIRGLRQENYRYGIYLALFSFVLGSAALNAPRYLFIWMPVILYVLYSLLVSHARKFIAKFALLAASLLVVVNLYWGTALLFAFGTASAGVSTSSGLSYLDFVTKNANVINLIRMMGSWAFGGISGDIYYPFATTYNNPILIISTVSIPAFAFIYLLSKKARQKRIFFPLLLLFGIFFAAGPNPPGGKFFLWIFKTVPYFYIFRDPTSVFEIAIVIAICAMFGFTLNYLFSSRIRSTFPKALLASLVLLLICLSGWPILTGAVMPSSPRGSNSSIIAGVQVNIPSYWNGFANFANSERGGRILLVPSDSGNDNFFWDPPFGYVGPDPAIYMLSASFVSNGETTGSNDSLNMVNLLYNCNYINSSGISNLLNLMNIEYVLYRPDSIVSSQVFGSYVECWNNTLSSNQDFEMVDQWGPLVLFQNMLWSQSNFYVGSTLSVFNGSAGSVAQEAEGATSTSEPIFVNASTTPLDYSDPANGSSAIISSSKEINPTEYQVNVNSNGSFILVFSQSYDSDWVASINGQQISDSEHIMVNGYANAWVINKSGTFVIDVSFWPQEVFDLALAVSLTSVLALVLFLAKSQLVRFFRSIVSRRVAEKQIR